MSNINTIQYGRKESVTFNEGTHHFPVLGRRHNLQVYNSGIYAFHAIGGTVVARLEYSIDDTTWLNVAESDTTINTGEIKTIAFTNPMYVGVRFQIVSITAGSVTVTSSFSTSSVGEGVTLSQSIVDALNAASSPSAGNPMATQNDIAGLTPTLSYAEATNKVSQSLTGSYGVLTNMSHVLNPGTYLLIFNGAFSAGANDIGRVAMFSGGTEIGGAAGHTERTFGSSETLGLILSQSSVSITTTLTLVAQTTVDVRGYEESGTAVAFDKGSFIALRIA